MAQKNSLKVSRFVKHVDPKAGGSATVGFADISLNLGGASIELQDATLRLNAEGNPSISAPKRAFENRAGQTRTRAGWRLDDELYVRVVKAVFADARVAEAAAEAAKAPRPERHEGEAIEL